MFGVWDNSTCAKSGMLDARWTVNLVTARELVEQIPCESAQKSFGIQIFFKILLDSGFSSKFCIFGSSWKNVIIIFQNQNFIIFRSDQFILKLLVFLLMWDYAQIVDSSYALPDFRIFIRILHFRNFMKKCHHIFEN